MINKEIKELVAVYNYRRSEGENIKLPAAIAWKRRVNYDKLTKASELIDEALKEIGERYKDDDHSEDVKISYKDEDGLTKSRTERRVKKEYFEEYATQLNDILKQETDVDIKKVKIDDLDGLELTDNEMDTLSFMIEE